MYTFDLVFQWLFEDAYILALAGPVYAKWSKILKITKTVMITGMIIIITIVKSWKCKFLPHSEMTLFNYWNLQGCRMKDQLKGHDNWKFDDPG